MNISLVKALPLTALLLATCASAQPAAETALPDCVALDGTPTQPNPVEKDGRILHFKAPAVRLLRTKADKPKGTVLIFPSGGYAVLSVIADGTTKAEFWNKLGYDAAILEYTINPKGSTRDQALKDALAAVALVRVHAKELDLHDGAFILMGGSAGGHLAARTVAALPEKERPNAVVLFYPAYLEETAPGHKEAGMPLPEGKLPRLLAAIAKDDNPKWVAGARAYAEAWNKAPGGAGKAVFHLFDDGGHGFHKDSRAAAKWPELLTAFESGKATKTDDTTSDGQHQGGALFWGFHRITNAPDLPRILLVGDSIANGYHAQVAKLLKGKANVDLFITGQHIASPNYQADLTKALTHGPYAVIHFNESGLHAWVPGRVPAGQYGPLFAQAVGVLRAGSPQAQLIWATNTPCTVANKPGVLDQALEKTITGMNNDARPEAEKAGMAIDDLHTLMADKLNLAAGDRWHWNGKGKAVQAEAVAACVLGALAAPAKADSTKEKPAADKPNAPAPARENKAVLPATQKGNGYDWMARHKAVLKVKANVNPDLVFIGDSITHFWGGEPASYNRTGETVLKTAFANHRILNLGCGSDRTQNILWRLDHGELEGLAPKWVVILAGTNNTSDGQTAEEIVAGIQAVCGRVQKQTPQAKIILMAIMPRDNPATSPRRKLIDTVNRLIADYAKKEHLIHLDIGAKFLDAKGSIPKSLMPDLCHPNAQGYQFWADALLPLLK